MIEQEMIAMALDCGATKAALVDGSGVVLSETFRDICKGNGCGNYGKCYMCPPDVGEIGPLMDEVRKYPRGLLYQTVREIEDSFDIEGMFEAGKLHMQCSLKIQEAAKDALAPGFLHLSSGGCRICDICAKRDNLPCRYPDKALPSLESYGVDVYRTTEPTPLKYINGQNTVTFFGMVLFTDGVEQAR